MISGARMASFPVLFTAPGNVFTLVAVHQMQMHWGCFLLGALAPAPALFVATRAACPCSGLIVLHLFPLIHDPDRRASPDWSSIALARLALFDQLIDCPGRTRIPPPAAQAHELSQLFIGLRRCIQGEREDRQAVTCAGYLWHPPAR